MIWLAAFCTLFLTATTIRQARDIDRLEREVYRLSVELYGHDDGSEAPK